MKRAASLLMSAIATFRKNTYRNFAALFILLAIITALVTIPTLKGHSAQHLANKSAKVSAHLPAQQQTAQSTTDQPAAIQPAGVKASAPAAVPAPTGSNKRTLTITPNVFTVTAGSTPAISIQSGNGKGVNMPLFISGSGGSFLFNFPAGPAKPSWNGQLFISRTAAPGTYTLNVLAQDNTVADYYGTITIHVIQPTFTISVQPQGYDAENDAVTYVVKMNRVGGFSEPITQVAASSLTEDALDCYYSTVDDSTIALACGQTGPVRPTSGTLTIQISTASMSSSVSTSYSLPALP